MANVRRFVPVPYDALDLAQSDAERLTILALYRRAHGSRWRPLPLSRDGIAAWHGLTRHAVQRILATMEGEGLIRWERSTRAGRSGMIEVLDPSVGLVSSEPAGEPAPFRQVSRHPESRANAEDYAPFVPLSSGDTSQEPAGEPAPTPRESTEIAVYSDPLNLNHNLNQNHEPRSDSPRASLPATTDPTLGDLLAIAARYSLEMQLLPMGSSLSPRECGAIGAALRRGLIPQELDSFVAWVLESNEEDARWLRDRCLTWSSLTRSDRWVVWLRSALAWEDRGRCDYEKPTAKQEKVEAFKTGLGDALEREKRKETAFDGLFTEVKRG